MYYLPAQSEYLPKRITHECKTARGASVRNIFGFAVLGVKLRISRDSSIKYDTVSSEKNRIIINTWLFFKPCFASISQNKALSDYVSAPSKPAICLLIQGNKSKSVFHLASRVNQIKNKARCFLNLKSLSTNSEQIPLTVSLESLATNYKNNRLRPSLVLHSLCILPLLKRVMFS